MEEELTFGAHSDSVVSLSCFVVNDDGAPHLGHYQNYSSLHREIKELQGSVLVAFFPAALPKLRAKPNTNPYEKTARTLMRSA